MSLDDIVVIGTAFKEVGVDIIHTSSGETVKWQKPVWGRMWQTPFAEHVKHNVDIPAIAVGDITLPAQINTIIADQRADLCALGRPHLNDAFFTRQAAGHYGVKIKNGRVSSIRDTISFIKRLKKSMKKPSILLSRQDRIDGIIGLHPFNPKLNIESILSETYPRQIKFRHLANVGRV